MGEMKKSKKMVLIPELVYNKFKHLATKGKELMNEEVQSNPDLNASSINSVASPTTREKRNCNRHNMKPRKKEEVIRGHDIPLLPGIRKRDHNQPRRKRKSVVKTVRKNKNWITF